MPLINTQDKTCVVKQIQMCIALIKRSVWPKSAMLFAQNYSCRAIVKVVSNVLHE